MERDRVFGFLTLALSGVYALLIGGIQETTLADAVGPRGLPRVYAAILAALSVVLIVRRPRASAAADDARAHPWRAAGLVLLGVLYIAVLPWLGYVLSLGLLLAATISYQSGMRRRRFVAIAAAGAVGFWLLFVVLLRIPQPAGLWPSLF